MPPRMDSVPIPAVTLRLGKLPLLYPLSLLPHRDTRASSPTVSRPVRWALSGARWRYSTACYQEVTCEIQR